MKDYYSEDFLSLGWLQCQGINIRWKLLRILIQIYLIFLRSSSKITTDISSSNKFKALPTWYKRDFMFCIIMLSEEKTLTESAFLSQELKGVEKNQVVKWKYNHCSTSVKCGYK